MDAGSASRILAYARVRDEVGCSGEDGISVCRAIEGIDLVHAPWQAPECPERESGSAAVVIVVGEEVVSPVARQIHRREPHALDLPFVIRQVP
jgi:hypothetical protein